MHDRFAEYTYIEFLYHPFLQALIIRSCDKNAAGAIALQNKDGNLVNTISSKPFSQVVYEQMDWIEEYSFRFRGVPRKYDNQMAMMFFLDEPQIMVGKSGIKALGQDNYIPYRKSELNTEISEEKIYQFGVSYAMRRQRDGIVKRLSGKDMTERGRIMENPIVGKIPTKQEIMYELDELLMSM